MLRTGFLLPLKIAVMTAAVAASAEPAPPASKPPVTITDVRVTPENPAADTLCQLVVEIDNRSDRPVSALAFTVEIAGRELPVYGSQLYLQAFPPGAVTELRLYNFWTSETGSPDRVLPVKVTLREARFVTIAKAENGDETWQLGEPATGLPWTVTKSLRLAKKAP